VKKEEQDGQAGRKMVKRSEEVVSRSRDGRSMVRRHVFHL
jgi:hypothetical protein